MFVKPVCSKFRVFLIFSLVICSFLGQKDMDRKFRGFMQRDTILNLGDSSFFSSKAKGEEENFDLQAQVRW